mmetsp:Transcript_1152/g.3000  ORF Transcript_1152/g.3000 Transcript_1152/m.3000 type:complete len:322 (+) Transcript_1152:178-1143(+)
MDSRFDISSDKCCSAAIAHMRACTLCGSVAPAPAMMTPRVAPSPHISCRSVGSVAKFHKVANAQARTLRFWLEVNVAAATSSARVPCASLQMRRLQAASADLACNECNSFARCAWSSRFNPFKASTSRPCSSTPCASATRNWRNLSPSSSFTFCVTSAVFLATSRRRRSSSSCSSAMAARLLNTALSSFAALASPWDERNWALKSSRSRVSTSASASSATRAGSSADAISAAGSAAGSPSTRRVSNDATNRTFNQDPTDGNHGHTSAGADSETTATGMCATESASTTCTNAVSSCGATSASSGGEASSSCPPSKRESADGA